MRYRVIALAAAVAAAGALLTGCSSGAASGGGSRNLTLTWKNTESAGLNAVLPIYQKENPDLNVTVSVGDSTALATTTRTQLSAKTASDIIWLWAGTGNPLAVGVIGGANLLTDLSDQPWANKFPDYINKLTQYGSGKVGYLPMDITTFGTFYNQQAVDKAGLKIPTTWTETLAFCAAAKAKGTPAYTFGPATVNESQNVIYNLVPTLVYGSTPDFESKLLSGATTFSQSDGWKQALDKYLQMQKAGCFPDNVMGQASAQSITRVAKGDALAMPTVGFSLAALKSEGPNVTWTWAPIPATDNPTQTIITASTTGGPGISGNAAHPDEAKKFLAWLAQPEHMNAYVQALAGTIPSVANSAYQADDSATRMQKYISDGKAVTFLNHYWPNPALEQTMQKDLQGMLLGSMTPDAVLADMSKVYAQKP